MRTTYFEHVGEVTLPLDVAEKCSRSGDCTSAVLEALKNPEVKEEMDKLKIEDIVNDLEATGGWDMDELNDEKIGSPEHRQANLERFLWIACGNIVDQEYEDINN